MLAFNSFDIMDIKCTFYMLALIFTLTCKTTGQTTEIEVVILGGGLAGITAANHLYNSGIKHFLVLEAQDYIGGRLKNVSFGGITLSEGANWVHYLEGGNDNPIYVLSKKLNLTGYINNAFDIQIKNVPGGDTAYNETLKAIEAAGNAIQGDNKKMPNREDQPLRSAFAAKGWTTDTELKSAIEWFLYDFEYAIKTDKISTRHYSGIPGTNMFITDPKGYATLVNYLAANFTEKILTRKIVKEIKYNTTAVEVTTNDGHVYKAKYSLCTFSTGVLATDFVKFRPELPSWKKEAVSRIPLAYYTHVLAKFPYPFWEDKEILLNVGRIHGEYPAIYNLNRNGLHPGSNILLFTAVDDDSLRVENQHENATIEELMKVLKRMYPTTNISRPSEIFVSKWSNNPYVKGSYSNAVVGSSLADFHNLQGRVDRLFFAGEACDEEYWGYLQGAYLTGLRQAKAIVNCINGKECAPYQPEKANVCFTGSALRFGRKDYLFLLCYLLVILLWY